MLYHLFDFLERNYQLPGASLFQFLSFRAALATLTGLIIGSVFGKSIIGLLRKKQIGESIRDLGLAGQSQKAGTHSRSWTSRSVPEGRYTYYGWAHHYWRHPNSRFTLY